MNQVYTYDKMVCDNVSVTVGLISDAGIVCYINICDNIVYDNVSVTGGLISDAGTVCYINTSNNKKPCLSADRLTGSVGFNGVLL